MTLKLAQGWQVMLADLSLILFLTTAASLATQDEAGLHAPAPQILADEAGPAGIFRAGGETSLAQWLASRTTDPREALTIEARYTPDHRDAALVQAGELAAQAAAAGLEPRIVIDRGAQDEVLAVFAFTGEESMARKLHGTAH